MRYFCFIYSKMKKIAIRFFTLQQNKLQDQGVQAVVKMNKVKFEPYGDLVDQTFSQFNENSITNQDTLSQIENDENDSENTGTNKTSVIPNFMSKILQDDEIIKTIHHYLFSV